MILYTFPKCVKCGCSYEACDCETGVDNDDQKFVRYCVHRLGGILTWDESLIKYDKFDPVSFSSYCNAIDKFMSGEDLTKNQIVYYLSIIYSFLIQQGNNNKQSGDYLEQKFVELNL